MKRPQVSPKSQVESTELAPEYRDAKYLRKIFDKAADACDGDYAAKVNSGLLAVYDCGASEATFMITGSRERR